VTEAIKEALEILSLTWNEFFMKNPYAKLLVGASTITLIITTIKRTTKTNK